MECLFFSFGIFLLHISLVIPHFLLTKMVPARILSVNASIDTIGKILLKIIPTLEEVSTMASSSLIDLSAHSLDICSLCVFSISITAALILTVSFACSSIRVWQAASLG